MKRIVNQSGFTLVEILLYLAISSFILLSVSGFVSASMRARAQSKVIAEVEQQGERIAQVISQTVRNSRGINAPAVGTSGSSLSVATTVSATNPTIFNLSGGNVTITEGSGSALPLNNNLVTISGLTFQNVSMASTPGSVRVQFTISYNTASQDKVYQYSKVFYATASVR